ncbi:unnamed protein product [Nesidiocoris tenuis]|uniref:Uncharacterized protein n=1 Tax=Nesidiocoris tenuis TaxID=355587 RepID=A0A6H5G9E1_9HEMI|nr:unnamed protein product [Nesidiocoris tenuis]
MKIRDKFVIHRTCDLLPNGRRLWKTAKLDEEQTSLFRRLCSDDSVQTTDRCGRSASMIFGYFSAEEYADTSRVV